MSSLTSKIGPKKQTSDHPCMDRYQLSLHRIPTLPIFRKNLVNSSRSRERLQVEGHKTFTKLSASGPETGKILQRIKGLSCIKFVQKFEFDPYLCDHSHLNHLRRICQKIKGLQRLNLVIRRVDLPNEVRAFGPFLCRFLKMTSLRIEFPGTKNVDEENLIQLYKNIGKCYQLRFCECKTVGMPEKSPKLLRVSSAYVYRLKWLEGFKDCEILRKGVMKNQGHNEARLRHQRQRNFLKVLDITLSSPGEWASAAMMDHEASKAIMKSLAGIFVKLEKIRIHIIRTTTTLEDLLNFFIMVTLIPTLYHAEFELLNCQATDMEFMAFAHGLTEAKHLKYFNLKIIQKPGISEGCIERFAAVLSKLGHLSKFDVYIRRLDFHPRAIQELRNRIGNFANIQCSCAKGSIHLYRINEE